MFMNELENELNVAITENGALGYKTTKSELVDFNFKVASYRNRSENEIKHDFEKVWNENNELAFKFLFYIRDARKGIGERRLFRVCLSQIMDKLNEEHASQYFNYIVEYGRYDDLFVFFGSKLENKMLDFIKLTLTQDMLNMKNNKLISLCAKWMPSINTSNKDTRQLAMKFIKYLDISPKEYRKMLAGLRKYSDILESKICRNQWSDVDYESVPSQANIKYNSAFLRHDETRRRDYLGKLETGEAKINSSVLFPHDIVHKYSDCGHWRDDVKAYDTALEAMWKGLPDYVKGTSNILVQRDGSGSMMSSIGNTKISALDVATALSIYFSEKCEGEFKNKFITFSSSPEIVDLSKLNTLHDKLKECYKYDDCSNTDIKKSFDLILKVAIKNNLKQEEIPNLLIISDMEFDYAHSRSVSDKRLFKIIEEQWNNAGYQLPKLIFWNVNSRTNTIPLTQNNNGVILVSGFSTAIVTQVLSEQMDPYKALLDILNSNRYSNIEI